jgi:hypothetical protein
MGQTDGRDGRDGLLNVPYTLNVGCSTVTCTTESVLRPTKKLKVLGSPESGPLALKSLAHFIHKSITVIYRIFSEKQQKTVTSTVS